MLTGAVMSGAVFRYSSVFAKNGLLQQTPRSFIAVIVLIGFRVILKSSLLLHTAYVSTKPKCPVISYWVRFLPTTNLRFSKNRYYTVGLYTDVNFSGAKKILSKVFCFIRIV